MDWKKLTPWNWYKKEQEQSGTQVPAEYQPGSMLDLHRNIDRVFENAFRGIGFPSWIGESRSMLDNNFFRPTLDIKESGKAYIISVEMAGVSKNDVQVEVHGDTLIIKGEKRQEVKDEKENYHCIERSYGSFQRVLSLPEDADPERLEANFKDGVLTMTIQRHDSPSHKRRQIDING